MKKSKCLLVALMVLCLFFGITSISFAGVCFVTDVECIADVVLSFDQYDSEPTSKKEWSAVRGYIVAENNYISFNFMFDQESINTLKHKVSSIFGGFGLEVEIVEKNGHLLDLDFITNNLPASSNPQRDTNVCDYTTNTGADDHVNALLIRNPENLQKDVWYEVCFVFKNNIPSSGVEIQPNLVIALDMDDLTYLYPDSIYKYLIRLLIEESNFLDQFEYYTLETDIFWNFRAYSDGREGIYWKGEDNKAGSVRCYSKSCLISAIEAINNEADGTVPALFTSVNLKPVKFTGESTIYLVSNNSLTPISNEQIYSLLGFRSNCVMVPDWNQIIEIPLHEKVIYESRIKKSILPSQNNYSSGDLIAYQVIPKVGPISCMSMAINSTTIYLFGDDNKFHPIQNEQVYFDLGYKYDWSDVVEISQELFDYYGEGDVVYGYDNNLGNLCSAEIPSTLIFMSSINEPIPEPELEPIPDPEPTPIPEPDPEPIPEELPTCNCNSFSLNKTGSETRIDNLIQFDRANGEIATLANGKTIITFFEDYDIYFTIINENGNIVKSRIKANTFTDYTQDNPSIILVGNNNFAIVWHSYKGDGDGYAIMLKIFNDDGDEILGETLINQSTANNQKTPFGSSLENGDFFVFWQSYEDGFGIEDGAGGQSYDIFGRKLSSTGEFLTDEFIVNQERINHQEKGQSVLLENGNTIITWQSRSTHEEYDNCKGNIFFRAINQEGNFLSNEIQVNTNNEGCQKHPTITALPESEFAIAWQSNHEYSNSYDIMLQYFNNQFQKNSNEIEFSSLSRSQTYPAITLTLNGCIIGTWNDDYIDNNGRAVVARAINCNHEFYRTETQINDYEFADQLKPKVSITPNNNVIIIWQGRNPETIGTSNTDNIYMQGFGITLTGYEEIPVSAQIQSISEPTITDIAIVP